MYKTNNTWILIIQRTKRLFNKLNILPWYAGTSISILFSWRNFFVHGALTHFQANQRVEYLSFPQINEKCAKGSNAEWSRISHIPNVYFDECMKHETVWRSCILLRWMTSKLSPASSSFLLLYSPFLQHWSILIISPNFFLSLFSFPKYFCFWSSYKSINLLPQCAVTRDNMSIMFSRRKYLINLGSFYLVPR